MIGTRKKKYPPPSSWSSSSAAALSEFLKSSKSSVSLAGAMVTKKMSKAMEIRSKVMATMLIVVYLKM